MGHLLHFMKRKLAWSSNCEVITILKLKLSFNTILHRMYMGRTGAHGKAFSLRIPLNANDNAIEAPPKVWMRIQGSWCAWGMVQRAFWISSVKFNKPLPRDQLLPP